VKTRAIIVMGVSGSGKTTLGTALAAKLGWAFADADDYHPEANRQKMVLGQALSDADRQPWLERLHLLLQQHILEQRPLVLACSALKDQYRQTLIGTLNDVELVFLQGNPETIAGRMKNRQHFMPVTLLESQFATLEPPLQAITLDIGNSIPQLLEQLLPQLTLEVKMKSSIGVIGLAVMGENLILNMASKGFQVSAFNRTTSKVAEFLDGRAKGKSITGAFSLEEFVASLERPRKIMLMVKAGAPVDASIQQLLPLLEAGDIIIDGGNSHYADTNRRVKELEAKGLLFIGAGVSGGEEGALLGPSIMPGGDARAWQHLKPIFQAIAAKVDDGSPCCDWVGQDGAGHFVKMVHNGIEYGDMQMIAEAYSLLKTIGLSNAEIAQTFAEWNQGELDSYLMEISSQILTKKDEETGKDLVDVILDAAGQKGTGKWTSVTALDVGAPTNTIAEAVFARCLSALKEERMAAEQVFAAPKLEFTGDQKVFIEQVRRALFSSKICSYAQGYQLMQMTAKEFGWQLNYGGIALMWREGCIIRARFLENIKAAYDANPNLANLLLDPYFTKIILENQNAWRQVVATAALHGVWTPAFSSALAYFDGYRTGTLSTNLVQAQRDYFGAHTYERTDKPRGEFFHTNWTGRGGTTASSTYTI
jgi:6-phosphogluconate dehydrogenase